MKRDNTRLMTCLTGLLVFACGTAGVMVTGMVINGWRVANEAVLARLDVSQYGAGGLVIGVLLTAAFTFFFVRTGVRRSKDALHATREGIARAKQTIDQWDN
ncbi:hypothetical protein [Burkholderia sp. S171]|jgi:hypothetical protein|uniref:hypothetical protein n=1 Tax=Burkholderia sp. S171 TaxID=1641860 RepID=UPI00131B928A|nr:hypothetical protein [Burkholderia sp. S171]